MPNPAPHTPTQTARRTLYGLNITVAAVVVVAIVVLVNWLVGYTYDRMNAGVKQWVRYDLTATRAYSLSPQTLKVLGSLEEPRRIVTSFRSTTPPLQRIRDLIDEYGRYGKTIEVEHLNPLHDVLRRDQFFNEVHAIYAEQLAPTQAAAARGLEALDSLESAFAGVEAALTPLLEADTAADGGNSRRILQTLVARSQEMRQAIEAERRVIDAELQTSLPGHSEVILSIGQRLSTSEQLLKAAVEFCNKAVDQPGTPITAKEALLSVAEQMRAAQRKAADASEPLRDIMPVESYESARRVLLSRESVAILSADNVRVIPTQDMFREVDPEIAERTGSTEPPFLGEERLTGALVSLNLTHPPLLVFLNGNAGSMLRPGGFSYVADRARAANFEVRAWDAQGIPNPYGPAIPPGDIPEPKPGQKAVYVVLPILPSSNPQAMAAGIQIKQQIAAAAQKQLDAGHSAMVILFPDFSLAFGAVNPIYDMIESWGITAQNDRIIVRETPRPDGTVVTDTGFIIDTWPTDLPVTQAMRGRPAHFSVGSPIVLSDKATGITHHDLIVFNKPRAWTVKGSGSIQELQSARFDPQTAADSFRAGVAAERGGTRLVVTAEPTWAMDSTTTFGSSILRRSAAGAALDPGGVADYPGNTELFLNTVYWLAGLDEMIAASARTQDIRRIGPISNRGMTAYRIALLAGMPLATLLVGLGVWLVRRRG